MMQFSWNGVFPAVTTKFREDESLDIPAFQKNLNALIDAGVHGLILAGSLGEASTLLNPEKLEEFNKKFYPELAERFKKATASE